MPTSGGRSGKKKTIIHLFSFFLSAFCSSQWVNPLALTLSSFSQKSLAPSPFGIRQCGRPHSEQCHNNNSIDLPSFSLSSASGCSPPPPSTSRPQPHAPPLYAISARRCSCSGSSRGRRRRRRARCRAPSRPPRRAPFAPTPRPPRTPSQEACTTLARAIWRCAAPWRCTLRRRAAPRCCSTRAMACMCATARTGRCAASLSSTARRPLPRCGESGVFVAAGHNGAALCAMDTQFKRERDRSRGHRTCGKLAVQRTDGHRERARPRLTT